MTVSVKPLHSLISDTFAATEVDEFLLRFKLDDVYTFIFEEIVSSHTGRSGNEMTVLLDAETAINTNILIKLGHSAHIYVCGSSTNGQATFPQQTQRIDNAPIESHERFLIIITTTTSYMVMQAPPPQDINDLGGRPGFWSFHHESIVEIADLLTASISLEVPAQHTDDSDYPVSSNVMNVLSHLGNFIENQQQNAIVLKNDFSLILEIVKSLSVRRSAHEILYLFVEKIATTVQTDRCSVVRIWEGEDEGHVLASHEDASVNNMVIDLNKYPEIKNTLETSQRTLINDIEKDPIVSDVSEQLCKMGVTAILLVPIVLFDPKVGTFLLRMFRKGGTFTQREVEFCQIVSETAANAIERADLFETIQKSNRSLERLATTDALTGLYNRRYLIEHLEDEITRAIRYKIPIACLLIDIDDFKLVNDTFGHLKGDEVLRDVSKRTLDSVRGTDIVARYGGEELIILLPQTNIDGAMNHANRLLQTISGKHYRGLPDDFVVTVSIGISLHESNDSITADEFIKKADLALYEAKRAGKNRLVVHHD
ncbi:MAG: sensor domain-containing diguanylate cyclase [Candidatus Hydrogenedentota bacterium]